MKFETKILHPNVSPSGGICMEILHQSWSPALTIPKVLLSIQSLMGCPWFDSWINQEARQAYEEGHRVFYQKAKEYTQLYAKETKFPS